MSFIHEYITVSHNYAIVLRYLNAARNEIARFDPYAYTATPKYSNLSGVVHQSIHRQNSDIEPQKKDATVTYSLHLI